MELIPLPSLKATTLTAAIETNLIARFACKTLIYDQQSGFMSDLMQSVCVKVASSKIIDCGCRISRKNLYRRAVC
jgi:hypothetical protein